jgi:formate dehydrogenase subunit gamma
MMRATVRFLFAASIVWLAVAFVAPAYAQQQPTTVNPTAQSVKEQELLKELRKIQGRGTLPDAKSQVLEQPAGRDWRRFHQVTLRWIGAIAILGILAVLVLFYLIRGMVRIENGRSGRTLVRFNAFERFVHWMTATSFIVLAVSGLNITFGKELLTPLIGPEAFSTWSQWAKYAHNYLSFPFTIGVVLMFLMWIAWNFPTGLDFRWLREGGGIVGNKHPPARRFNAGQKAIYWIVVLGGAAVAITGYVLMFPFYATAVAGFTVGTADIAAMQLAQMVHGIAGLLFVAIMLAHIYIGTIGMEGAFEAMGRGRVDVNWAQQHHSLWLERQRAKGRVEDGRVAPAE